MTPKIQRRRKNKKSSAVNSLVNRLKNSLPDRAVVIHPPSVPAGIENMPMIERVYESFLYNLLCIEYAISPKGGLRQWLKLNFAVFLLLAIPIFLFIPLATYFFSGIADITNYIKLAIFNVLYSIVAVIGIVSIFYIFIKRALPFFKAMPFR